MAEVPRRIVSLVPSATETLFELGAGDRLVAATRYCVSPEEGLRGVPRVGGTKNPKLDEIADFEPDLIIANSEENRSQHIAWLRERFPVFETMPRTVHEGAAMVRELGRIVGGADLTEVLLLEIEAQVAAAQVADLHLERVRAFYAVWKKPWMGVNRDTYIHDLLERAGAANVTADIDERYPTLQEDELADLGAELVLLPSEPFPFEEVHREELLGNALFGLGVPVLLVDGKDFCWHGARSGRGLGRAVEVLKPYRRAKGT